MPAKLVVSLIVEAFDCRLFDSSVHSLDLSVGPRVLGLSETMIDVVLGTGQFKGMATKAFPPLDHRFNLGWAPCSDGIGEVNPIISKNDVDFVGNGFD